MPQYKVEVKSSARHENPLVLSGETDNPLIAHYLMQDLETTELSVTIYRDGKEINIYKLAEDAVPVLDKKLHG